MCVRQREREREREKHVETRVDCQRVVRRAHRRIEDEHFGGGLSRTRRTHIVRFYTRSAVERRCGLPIKLDLLREFGSIGSTATAQIHGRPRNIPWPQPPFPLPLVLFPSASRIPRSAPPLSLTDQPHPLYIFDAAAARRNADRRAEILHNSESLTRAN